MADAMQFIVLSLSILIVVPLILSDIGGWHSFVSQAPEHFFSISTPEFSPLFLACWIVIHFFKIGGEWAFTQRFLCVSTERNARKAAYIFGLLFLISPLLWMLPPMIYRTIDPQASPQQAYILACRHVLPPGMIGILMASMFAATASMADSEINVFAGALTRNILGRLQQRYISEKGQVRLGRTVTFLLGVSVILIALAIPDLGGAQEVVLKITSMLVTPMALPLIWGLYSKKVGSNAIWATLVATLLAIAIFKGMWGSSSWVIHHVRLVETGIIGILVPTFVMLIIQLFSSKPHSGFVAVCNSSSVSSRTSKDSRASNYLPHKILTIFLFIFSLSLGAIGITHSQGRSIILTAAVITAWIALAGHLSLTKIIIKNKYLP